MANFALLRISEPVGVKKERSKDLKDGAGSSDGASKRQDGGSRSSTSGRASGSDSRSSIDPTAGVGASSGDPVAGVGRVTEFVNMFEGSERASGRASTMAGLFEKVDQLVYPGRDSKEATDTMSAPERFAMCGVGTHCGTSGYLHVYPPNKGRCEKGIRHLAIVSVCYMSEGISHQTWPCGLLWTT
jgi:hypothetical protein